MRSDKVTESHLANLTRTAKNDVRRLGITLREAKDRLARSQGYEDWREMQAIAKRQAAAVPAGCSSLPRLPGVSAATQEGVPLGLGGLAAYLPRFSAGEMEPNIPFGRWLNPGRIIPYPKGWTDIRTAYGKAPLTYEVLLAIKAMVRAMAKDEIKGSFDPVTEALILGSQLKQYQLAWGEIHSIRARGFIHGPREDIDFWTSETDRYSMWQLAGANRGELSLLTSWSLFAAISSLDDKLRYVAKGKLRDAAAVREARVGLVKERSEALSRYLAFCQAEGLSPEAAKGNKRKKKC